MGVIAKYKFNNTLADLLPEFNTEFTSDLYTVTDEVNGEVTTRTIESDNLPTLMRFGAVESSAATERSKSLLEIISLDISNCKNLYHYFRYCINLTTVNGLIVHSGIKNLDNMFGNCNSLEFVDTSSWDTSNVTIMSFMFLNCNNLTSLDVSNWETSNVTDMHNMFHSCYNLTSLNVSNFNTSKVTNMNNMFSYCTNLTSLDVSNFDTSNVTNMYGTFWGCNNLTSLDVSNWNTSKVNNMNGMFLNCTNLTSLDVSNWNTSNVNNMVNLFNSCTKLTSLDVSNWNTSNVTTMNGMFAYCNNLTSLDVSNWNTSNVTDMYQMFRDCSSLVSLDVSRFDTSKVTTMYCMFYNCRNLAELNVSNWNTSNVESMYSMFCNCIRLLSLDISKWDTSKNVNIDYMFSGYNYDMNLVSLDINNFNIDNINRDYSHLFERMPHLKYLKCKNTNVLNTLLPYLPTKSSTSQGTIICKSDITNLDTTVLQSKYWNILDEPTLIAKYVFDKSIHNNCMPEFNAEFEGYFIEDEVVEGSNEVTRTIESCGMLPTLMKFGNSNGQYDYNRRMSLLKMLNICNGLTSCNDMFAQCSNLISVCDIDTSNVTSMFAMFFHCTNLTTLDLSSWNISNVIDMRFIFYFCTKLTSLDVSNFNTSNVTDMSNMFYGCTKLTSLDVSNFNTSNVTNMYGMFGRCQLLTSLDLSNWDTSNVTDTTNMFTNTPLLTDIGVLYMDKSSLQKLVDAIPTDSNKTLWYKDVNIDGITHGDNITLKKYMEGNVEIVLNSPLLEGDTIEVKDGKLCHYHRYEKVVLDGSENWTTWINSTNPDGFSSYYIYYDNTTLSVQYTLNVPSGNNKPPLCDKLIGDKMSGYRSSYVGINSLNGYLTITLPHIELGIDNNTTIDDRLSSFKQWLSKNPTTVVYELETPYYEDITNLQSAPTLKTYLECSMEIDTDLPIDTNVTYRTNLSSVYVMERELDELDNGIDLGDILEGEVNE